MTVPLLVLIVGDSENFFRLISGTLSKSGYVPSYLCVEDAQGLRAALRAMKEGIAGKQWDIIISDHEIPGFGARAALRVLQECGCDLPLIMVSDAAKEDEVLEILQEGAFDHVLKSFISHLGGIVQRGLLYKDRCRRPSKATDYLAAALETAGEAIIIVDKEQRILNYNQSAAKIFGYPVEEVLGQPLDILLPESAKASHSRYIQDFARTSTISRKMAVRKPVSGRRKDGSEFTAEVSISKIDTPSGAIFTAILRDVSESMVAAERLHHYAFYDTLTKLPNRLLLMERVDHSLSRRRDPQNYLAILLLDLDRFKIINDTLGHDIGDRLLRALPERLLACVREEDTVARLGGDEFCILLEDVSSRVAMSEIAERIIKSISQPFMIDGHELFTTCSIGISHYPGRGKDAGTLMQHVDAAMYIAKGNGGNTYQFYAADITSKAADWLSLENGLRRALEREEFVLHYQFQASLISGKIVGAEALIRWQHPQLGLLGPIEFIPLLEEMGLTVPVGEWVLTTACAQIKAWQKAGLPDLRVDVNLWPHQFIQEDFTKKIEQILNSTNLESKYIGIEITEGSIFRNFSKVLTILHDLNKMGIYMSIDDFGTGYSSLSYLKQMPVSALKIDRSFIKDIISDPDSAAIVRAIIAMSHSMKIEVVAEGVETEAQMSYLIREHCDTMQGYFFNKPMPADEITRALQEGHRLAFKDGLIPNLTKRTLLVLDDDENITSAIKRMLHRDGYRVLTANRAADAFELLAVNQVGVIISDQRMPEMNGTDFLLRAKDLYPDSIRMVLSGYTELQSVTDAINKGAIYKFLTKPWDDNLLRANIRDAFEYHEMLRDRKLS